MHPILRAVVLGLTGGILFALPAIIILALDSDIHLFPDVDSKDQRYARQIVVKWFSYCAIMWVISIVLFNAIDAIPQLVMNVTKRRGRQPSETLKTHLSFFWKVRSYVKVALSSAFGLVFFIILFPNNGPFSSSTRQQWAQIVFQVISCVTILSILMCLEKLAIQRIAVNFHRTAYKDRLAKLKEGLRILDQLGKATANAPGTATADHLSRPGSPMRASSPSSQAQSQQQQNQQMHRRIGSEGSTISPGYDKIGGGFTSRFRKLKNKAVKTGGADVDIYSTEHGKRLARKLYYALAYRPPVPGAASPGLSAAPTAGDRSSTIAAATPYWLPETITIAEFRPYFDTEEEAEKAFAVFDRDGNGDISRREMRDAVLSIYKERKSLMTSLHDMSQVVGKLNRILVAFTLLVFLISALMVLGTDPLKSLASIGTIIIGWSFIFGTTFRTIFECIVFLFFTHPYDAGDTVMVAGDTYTVHKVRLLSTIFIKTDGMYTCYPNSVLASMMIRNFRRSPEQSESIYVHFDFTTPQHQLDEIKTRMTQFVLDHPRDYMDSIGFNVDMMENCNKLIMSIGLNYRSNWQSGAVRWERRTKFMFALRQSILEVGVRYHLPDQPVYHLNAPPPYSMVASHGTLSNNNGDGGGHDIHAGHDVSRYPSNMSLRTSASSASTMVYSVAPYQSPSATTVTGVTLAVPTASIAPYHHPLHQSPPPPLPQATIMVSQPSIGGMLSVANHQLDLQAPQSVTTSSAVSTASSTAVSASAAPSIVSTAGTTTQRRKQKHPLQQVQFAKDPDSIAGASSSSSGPSTSSSSNANSVAQPSTAAAMAAFSSGMSSLAD
ncbi:hypothetical protein GQ42DRAFT_135321 [Ramicandelaber brevisporus]|nr:hypothetical protein GQ42DRAFT_135321 [Ramicandelaber brevisporus]